MGNHRVSFLVRIAMTVMLGSPFGNQLAAYDLAPTELRNSQLASGCFAEKAYLPSTLHPSPNLAPAATEPNVVFYAGLTSNYSLLSAYVRTAAEACRASLHPSRVVQRLAAQFVPSWSDVHEPTWMVAAPEAGNPPKPAALPATSPTIERQLVKQVFLEDYMPYDFSIRDWRFRQFSFESKAPQVASSYFVTSKGTYFTPEGDRQANLALVEGWLRQVEHVQCAVASELMSMQQLREAAEYLGVRWMPLSSRAAQTLASATSGWGASSQAETDAEPLNIRDLAPYYDEPFLVIYELPDGKQLVLTAEQAQCWNVIRLPAPPVKPSLAVTKCPLWRMLNQQLTSFFQQRWDAVHSSTTQLTQWFEHLSEVRVALQASQEIR